MDLNNNYNMQTEIIESRRKKAWRNFGIFVLSVALAILTIIVVNF